MAKPIDLTGQRFGKLTVIEKTEKRSGGGSVIWKCQCDCGNICEVASNDLKSGNTQSCGCLRKELSSDDLTGQRFGRLTVLEKTEKRVGKGCIVWKCQCDCGNICEGSSKDLNSGHKQSCGCLNDEILKGYIDTECVYGTKLERLNTKLTASNKSGRKVVCWVKKTRKWMAFIQFQKKSIYLGSFDKFEDAVKARERAEEELWEPTLNEFGRELK